MDTPEGRMKVFILIATFTFFISAFALATMKYTSSSKFCASCHEMYPEYFTWNVSAHSQISCTTCHVEPGMGNLFIRQIKASKELYEHVFDKFLIPISLDNPIGNEVCLQCHTKTRLITASGDITIPHERHIAKGLECLDCHRGTSHGMIAERQITVGGAFDLWSSSVAKEEMKVQYRIPQMITCMECHRSRGITTSCAACHKEISDPISHRAPEWKTDHGKSAEKDLKPCETCHSYANIDILPKSKRITGAPNKAIEYARRNPFCADCHSRRPPSHDIDWMQKHPIEATPSSQKCFACHSVGKPTSSGFTTKTYCGQCHKGQHRPNWRSQHPRTVDPSVGIKPYCFTCHGVEMCSRCHMDKNE